jgi:hypothetical protein
MSRVFDHLGDEDSVETGREIDIESVTRREVIDAEGAEMRILQGGAGVLRDHRPILFYESFNHRAEILALLKGYGYLVFESDRYQAIVPETTNFVALPLDRGPAVTSALAALGYPIPSRRG